jgi:hypothetical protein
MSDASAGQDQGTKPPIRIKVSLLTLLALLPLSVSLYTTSEGMLEIVPGHWVLARFLPFIIICVFGVMSMQIGRSLAEWRASQSFSYSALLPTAVDVGLRAFVFAVLFFFAFFFSFKFYFSALYNSAQSAIDTLGLTNVMTSKALDDVRVRVSHFGQVSGEKPEIKAWITGINAISQLAEAHKSDIDAATADAVRQQTLDAASATQAAENLKDLQGRADVLRAGLVDQRKKLADARKRLNDAEARRTNEELGANGAVPGKRTKWRKADADVRAAQADVDAGELAIHKVNSELSGPDSHGGVAAEIADLTAKLKQLRLQSGPVQPTNVVSAVAALEAAAGNFTKSPSLDNYDAVVKACKLIAGPLRQAAQFDERNLRCENAATRNALSEKGTELSSSNQFVKNCYGKAIDTKLQAKHAQLVAENADGGAIANRMFDEAAGLARSCLTSAEDAGINVDDARQQLNAFVQRYSPERDPTTIAVDGLLFRQGPAQASMAYAFALAQELLVLTLTFLAEWMRPRRRKLRPSLNPADGDTTRVRAAKLMLANREVDPVSSRNALIDLNSPRFAGMDSFIRTEARAILMDFAQEDHAKANDTPDSFTIGRQAIESLEDVLSEPQHRHLDSPRMSATSEVGMREAPTASQKAPRRKTPIRGIRR